MIQIWEIRRCRQGHAMDFKDELFHSRLDFCATCHTGHLSFQFNGQSKTLVLSEFDRYRFGHHTLWPWEDLTRTQEMVHSIGQSQVPSPGQLEAFGIARWRQLHAMRRALENGLTAFDLQHVVGYGSAISQMVQMANKNQFQNVAFDVMPHVLLPFDDDDGVGLGRIPRLEGRLARWFFRFTAARRSKGFFASKKGT